MSNSDPRRLAGAPAVMFVALVLAACAGRDAMWSTMQMEADQQTLDRITTRHFDAYNRFRQQADIRYAPTHRSPVANIDADSADNMSSPRLPACSTRWLPAE